MSYKTFCITPMLFLSISLQALSDDWLVKRFVAFDGTQWQSVELSYDTGGRVYMVQILNSCDKEQWRKDCTRLFVYDDHSQLVRRVDYKFSGTADSSVVWSSDISCTGDGTVSVSQSYDVLSAVSCKLMENVQAGGNRSCSSVWTFADGRTAHSGVTFHCSGNELDYVDYSFVGASDCKLHYRCSFVWKSPVEHHAVWQVLVDGCWTDSLCSKSFYDAQGLLSACIQYRFDGTALRPQTKVMYRYDDSGDMLSSVVSVWQGEFWQHVRREVYRYSGLAELAGMTFHNYRYCNWLDAGYLALDYNEDGMLDRVASDDGFWSEGKGMPVHRIRLPGNLKSRTILASEADFFYIEKQSDATGVPESDVENPSVFPNPSSTGLFHVEGVPDIMCRYDVYDSCGMLLMSGTLFQGTADMGCLPDGVYVVRLKYGNRTAVRKLIIAR